MKDRVIGFVVLATVTQALGCSVWVQKNSSSTHASRPPDAAPTDAANNTGADGSRIPDGRVDGGVPIDAGPDADQPLVLLELAGLRSPDGGPLVVHNASSRLPELSLIAEGEAGQVTPTLEGVTFSGGRLAGNAEGSDLLGDALLTAGSFTLEVWVRASDANQGGPARIVTYSNGFSIRAFTLGQEFAEYVVRVRSSDTGPNGNASILNTGGECGPVELLSTSVFPTGTAFRQLVLVFDGVLGQTTISVDGQPSGVCNQNSDGGPATLDVWETAGYRFTLADEPVGERVWQGEIRRVTLFDRTLSAAEITLRFQDSLR